MTDQNTIQLLKKLDVTDLAGEKVMIDFDSGKYFLLKGPANDIWEFIQEPVTIGDIVKGLQEIYEVEETVCRESIETFLNQLLTFDFISIQ